MDNKSLMWWLPLLLFLFLSGCQNFSSLGNGRTALKAAPGSNRRCPDVLPLTDQVVADSINVSLERLAALKTNRSLSNSDICTMPDKALKRAFARLDKPKADQPGEWAEFRNLQRQSEDGKVKPDGLIKGIRKRKELLKEFAVKAAAVATDSGTEYVPPAAGLESNQWTTLGPGNVGGRIRAIAIHPTDTNKLWLGSVAGGIWHSPDGGASWNPVNDFMGNLSISSIIIDPSNPNVMYAGTGEGFFNSDAVRGYGVFKTTDGGVTWDLLPSTTPASDINNAAYGWYYVNRLAISNNGATILAATRGYYSNWGAIFRSTDGGASWTQTYSGRTLDLRCDPNDPSKAVASVIDYNFTTNQYESHIVKSVDGGQTWTKVKTFTNSSGRIELAYAKSNSQIIYASRDHAATASGEIWKSADGGANWSLVSTPQHLGSQGWYDNTIWVDPTDDAHLVIGGLDLKRSTDAGVTWTKISNWVYNMYIDMPYIPHADHHVLVADPGYNGTTNKKLYNGNDGGIFRANDISVATETSGWETLNNGLSVTQFYSVAGRTAAGGRIIGGTQDNGSLRQSGAGTNWQTFAGGDGGFSAVDSQNDNYLYGEYPRLKLHRSTDGGATLRSDDGINISNGILDAGTLGANFIAPFILDPNDNNRMLAGGASLWQSMAVKSPTPAWTAIKDSTGSNISAIAVAGGNSGMAWVGHNNGEVYQTSTSLDATPVWTRVGAGVLPGRMVNRILIDKDNPNNVYAAFGGYNADNLYRTSDNGATWANITGNLPAVPIFTIARHPANANWLYAGTEVGLFTSEDWGNSWFTTNDGPANVEISELSWMDNSTLLAATHGRGIFRVTISAGPDTTPPTVSTTFPAAGATWAAIDGAIRATFNEPVNPATINAATFTLDNGVTGAVSYNTATYTATFTPSASLAPNTTYTATITTGVTDEAGNPMAAAKTWSFTTAPTVTLFSDGFEGDGWLTAQVSGINGEWRMVGSGTYPIASPHGGLKMADFNSFTSDPGDKTRLYKTAGFPIPVTYDTATLSFWMYHDDEYLNLDMVQAQVSTDGSTWSDLGEPVARYDGTNGWAQANVDLSSYKGQSNVRIAFVGISDYGNDIYLDDVSVLASDSTPPAVISTTPANGATAVAVTSAVTATFSEPLNPATINATTFTLDNGVTGTVSYDPATYTATFTPSASLSYNTTYSATITTGVKDPLGNPPATAKTWSFTTSGPPQHTLSATMAGSGAGSVTSTPPGLSCTAGTCPAQFDAGSQVTLSATPNANSLFDGWSGACSGTGNCTVTIDADKAVTATFSPVPLVKIGSSSYVTLQGAYDAALDGNAIMARELEFVENLTLNRNIAVTLKGGYDNGFATNPGFSSLKGVLTISQGTLKVENLAIK